MKKQKKWMIGTNQLFITCILLGGLTRCLPHPANLSPMMGLSVFGVAQLSGRWRHYALPFITYFISDLFLNNVVYRDYFEGFTLIYSGWQYLAYLIIIFLSEKILRPGQNLTRVFTSSLIGTLVFFIISNFGVWATGEIYPKSFPGLITCYIAGLPFLKVSMIGNFLSTVIFFGIFTWLQKTQISFYKYKK